MAWARTTSTASGTASACALRSPRPNDHPASSQPALVEGMTVTIGHPVLAIPGFGGVRFEDVYRLGQDGPHPLAEYPNDPVLEG